MIGPEKRTAPELAQEYGISVATIYGWKAKLKTGTLSLMNTETSSNKRSLSEKLILLFETRNISDAEMGEWLRRNGLHTQHLELWEQEIRNMLDQKNTEQSRKLKSTLKN